MTYPSAQVGRAQDESEGMHAIKWPAVSKSAPREAGVDGSEVESLRETVVRTDNGISRS